MKNKKIVFFDIDGTIYKFTIGIPKDTMESIAKLKENGHIPVICTGRTRAMIYDEFMSPGFEYIVGGAGTYLEAKGEQKFLFELEKESITEILDAMKEFGFSPVVECVDMLYLEYENEKRNHRGNKIVAIYRDKMKEKCIDIKNAENLHASKVSGIFQEDSNLKDFAKKMEERYSVINHGNDLIELVPKPYSKATGIEALINLLGIPWENTYAFGDSFNDLEMLQYVNYGVCMGNSDEELFQYTNYRTEAFNEGGITNALKRFGLI